jgi:hypothetical protein
MIQRETPRPCPFLAKIVLEDRRFRQARTYHHFSALSTLDARSHGRKGNCDPWQVVEGEEPYIIYKYGKEEKAFDTLVRLVARCAYALIGVDRARRKSYIL